MCTKPQMSARYLVEWYRPNLTRPVVDEMVAALDRSLAVNGDGDPPVSLLLTLAVPSDEVLFGVFAADSAELVQTACARAGLVPERLSQDVEARITERV